jgi:hypothetical protein
VNARNELAAALGGGTLGIDTVNGAIYLEHGDGNRDYVTGRPTWSRDIYAALVKLANEKPRTVETLEEAQLLPHETVIRDAGGMVFERWYSDATIEEWTPIGTQDDSVFPVLPATVLFTPDGEG